VTGFSAPDRTVTVRLEDGLEVTVGAGDVARQSPHPPGTVPVCADVCVEMCVCVYAFRYVCKPARVCARADE